MSYSFTAVSGRNQLELKFVIEEDEPVKLGDGSFGCVFHVRDDANVDYALKLFYESDDKFVTGSQKEEVSIGDRLRGRYIDTPVAPAVGRYLVTAQGHVDQFRSSPAYGALKEYFERLSFQISDRAFLMEFYPLSLKDLLERGWTVHHPQQFEDVPPAPTDGNKNVPVPGYDVLRKLPQQERERSILPFVADIAEALSILHDANFHHQDIKPANVLVRPVGPNIHSALADLGFINTGVWQAHGSLQRDQPLGTRHYRSPEQTDYFDICEVDISKQSNGGYRLVTYDPKFLSTFSEAGDLVVFAKRKHVEPIQWEIREINSLERDGQIIGKEILIKDLEDKVLHEDSGTQISVHKRQTARTDLFGLGAIMYDMLTCGRSPEQFYDLLRIHDRDGETIQKGLGQRYHHFKNGGGTMPEIDTIFQSLRVDQGSGLPHPSLVNIILKCMMSRPEDSYFRDGTWNKAKADIANLMVEAKAAQFTNINVNYLTKKERPPPIESKSSNRSPEEQLREIQNLSYSSAEDCARRLIDGTRFVEKVVRMIARELQGGPDFNYLVNVSPAGLQVIRGEFSPNFALFEKEEDFRDALESGNPKSILQTFSAGNLLPPFMHALVRECEVWAEAVTDLDDGDTRCLKFDLWGPNFGWPGVNTGDRLIMNLSADVSINTEITNVDGESIVVSQQDHRLLDQLASGHRYRASIVKNLHPSDYYVSMFGVYIRLVYFVNLKDGRAYVPQSLYCFEQGRPLGLYRDIRINEGGALRRMWRKLRTSNHQSRLESFFFKLAGVYIQMITRQLGDWGSDHISLAEEGDTARKVERVFDDLKKQVANVLGCSEDFLMAAQDVDGLIKEISAKNRKLFVEEFPNIEEITNKIVSSLRSEPAIY